MAHRRHAAVKEHVSVGGESDTRGAALLLALAAIALSIGTASWNPNVGSVAAILALILTAVAFVSGDVRWLSLVRERPIVIVLVCGVVLELTALLLAPPVAGPLFLLCLAAAGVLGIAAILNAKVRTAGVLLAIVIQSAALCWMVAVAVPDGNDVYLFNQVGSQAILDGENPYGLKYENIYGQGTPLYAHEVQEGDHLTFGYPYPPLSLLFGLPGYVLAGDYRYAGVIAVGASALLAFFARPGAVSAGAAVLLMMSPLTLRLVLNGWTEVFAGIGVAAVAFAVIRLPRTVPYLLGLAIAIKQYVAPVWLLALLLLRGMRGIDRRTLIIAPIVVALATVLPFFFWSPGDFLFSVVVLQGLQPFRLDSASILGMIARAGGPELPTWIGFVAGGATLAFAAWGARRTVAGLCAASALVFLAFFLFSKQAFMNYYYFVFVLLALAIATSDFGGTTRTMAAATGSTVEPPHRGA